MSGVCCPVCGHRHRTTGRRYKRQAYRRSAKAAERCHHATTAAERCPHATTAAESAWTLAGKLLLAVADRPAIRRDLGARRRSNIMVTSLDPLAVSVNVASAAGALRTVRAAR